MLISSTTARWVLLFTKRKAPLTSQIDWPYKVELIVRIWHSLLGDLTAAVHALKAACSSYLSVSILGYSHLLEHSSLLSGSRYFVHFCTYSFYFTNGMNCFTKSSSFLSFPPSPSPHFFLISIICTHHYLHWPQGLIGTCKSFLLLLLLLFVVGILV
jgi:hypothetical protein